MEGKEAERVCKLELMSGSCFVCCCLSSPLFPPFQLAQQVSMNTYFILLTVQSLFQISLSRHQIHSSIPSYKDSS